MMKKYNYNLPEKEKLQWFAKSIFIVSITIVILGELSEQLGRLVGQALN